MKLTNINNSLHTRQPLIVVITETKSQTRCSAALPNDLYKFFEQTGQPCTNYHIAKWRIVVGVRRALIQVQQRQDIHSDLKGRVIVLDTVLMTTSGSAMDLRIAGTYASHDPGGLHGNEADTRFWVHITDMCKSAHHAWITASDKNATLVQAESRLPRNNQVRRLYRQFLQEADGTDLCLIKEDANYKDKWTCKQRGTDNNQGASIINRVATASRALMDGTIKTLIDFCPGFLEGALYVLKNPDARVSQATHRFKQETAWTFARTNDPEKWFKDYLKQYRKEMNKTLYRATADKVSKRSREADTKRMIATLLGQSSKRLIINTFSVLPLPFVTNHPTGTTTLTSNPTTVKAATQEYFQTLYKRQFEAQVPKPWLICPSMRKIKEKVKQEPFTWPGKTSSITNMRTILRCGNARPAPGPDGWEKWCVKAASDALLTHIVRLHDYIIMGSHFPEGVCDKSMTIIHKRGSRLQLLNYCGIGCQNLIAATPFVWFNHLFMPYAARLGIILEIQIAAQQGVQARELTSLLGQTDCWATRTDTTILALKRNQMKGFDYLAPQGFYNAISALGLPEAITDLKKSALLNNKMHIRTAYGVADPITVNEVLHQGSTISPLKSAMTTGMGHRYLNDFAKITPGALEIKTLNSIKHKYHTPADLIKLTIAIIEATDDIYIFATNKRTLARFVLEMEHSSTDGTHHGQRPSYILYKECKRNRQRTEKPRPTVNIRQAPQQSNGNNV